MRIFDSINEDLSVLKQPVVTIGNFDGVHLGHIEVLKKMKEAASQNGGDTVIITFKKHPKTILYPEHPIEVLSSLQEKIENFSMYGIDNVILFDFDIETAGMHAGYFINEVLLEKIGFEHIIMGYDHAFGKNREGNIDYLIHLGSHKGFKVSQIDPLIIDNHPVSSTRIRNEIIDGNIESANRLLGREYSLKGKVVRGFGRGKKIGFPTANISLFEKNKVMPKDGVYAVTIKLSDNIQRFGMLNIGNNPTFNNNEVSIEVNIFDFDSDIYDKEITVSFSKNIRVEKTFNSIDDLVNQIEIDKKDIFKFFKI